MSGVDDRFATVRMRWRKADSALPRRQSAQPPFITELLIYAKALGTRYAYWQCMEPIRLSGEQLKTLREAIPFQRPVHTTPDEPPILPASDLSPAPMEAGEVGVAGVADAEPYRKKFRKKPGGDVISGPSQGNDSDVLTQSLNDLHSVDGGSPL